MSVSNGNYTDENDNVVNIVQLLRSGEATPITGDDGHYMAAHSGWFTDENGDPANLITVIQNASGGSGSVAADSFLSSTSKNSVQNKVVKQAIDDVNESLQSKASTAVATTSTNGLMSSTDKTHLDAVYADYSSAITALGVSE